MRVLLLVTLLLAGCGQTPAPCVPSPSPYPTVTVEYLERLYAIDNDTYFHNKLTRNIRVELSEEKDMATVMCYENGTCLIKFNPRYAAAERVADFTMLHEMCHIKVWGKEVDGLGQQVDHGKVWRSCMLQLDSADAFREIIIDNYRGTQ